MFRQTMFLFLKHETPMRHISLTQAVILSCTSNFFVSIAMLCISMRPQVKNVTVEVFCFRYSLQPASWETHAFYRGFKRSRL